MGEIIKKPNLWKVLRYSYKVIILFAFYAFAFLLTEMTVNTRAAELWGAGSVLGVYTVGLVCTGSGYLAYTLSQRCLPQEKHRKLLVIITSVLALGGALVLLHGCRRYAIPSGWLALFAMGFLAAAIYYYTACALVNHPFTGRIIGLSMFLAVLLQYGVTHAPWDRHNLLEAALVIAVIGMCILVRRPLGDWCFEDALPYEKSPARLPKEGILAALMVAFMTLGFSFSDECVTILDAGGELDVAAWPRLFYGVGLLLSGWLVDIERRRYIYSVTAIAFSLALLSPGFLLVKLYNASLGVMYLYSGFYVMFLTTAFLDLAPRTAEPWLWAGMGRMVRSFTTAAVLFPVDLLMDRFGVWGVLCGNTLITIVVLLLSVYAKELQRRIETRQLVEENEERLSQLNEETKQKLAVAVSTAVSVVREEALRTEEKARERFTAAQATAEQALLELEKARNELDLSREELRALEQVQQETNEKTEEMPNEKTQNVRAFAEKFELTPRETEVLEIILTKDGTTKELAKELMISERVCQRYLTSIYDKTGCDSKVGLILYYYGAVKKQ